MTDPDPAPEFVADDGEKIIGEAVALLGWAQVALRHARYVEANGWIEAAQETLADQDVFGMLAAGEIVAASMAPPWPAAPDDTG